MREVVTYFRVYEEADEPEDWNVTEQEYQQMMIHAAYEDLDRLRELLAPADVELVNLSIDEEEVL
jgi:hypothetical protein